MRALLTFTPQPVRITANNTRQQLWTVLDVLDYDILDLELGVVESAGGGTVYIDLYTGLDREVGSDWHLITSVPFFAANTFAARTITGEFLRYVGWSVSFSGGATAATIWVRGIARSYGDTHG
jgi:hypothetical protein